MLTGLAIIGLIIGFIAIVILGIWMFIIGVYDTFFADKASFWSITYLVLGFMMVFGGSIGGSKSKR